MPDEYISAQPCAPHLHKRPFGIRGAPAWHIEHFPASFWPRAARPGVVAVEDRLPKATIDELKRRGHKLEISGTWSEGRLTAASQEGVRRKAAANPRGMQGYAAGR